MTVIVGVIGSEGMAVASDSCVSFGAHRDICHDKLWCVGKMVMGAAGDSLAIQALRTNLVCTSPGPSIESWASKVLSKAVVKALAGVVPKRRDCELLVATGRHLVEIQSDGAYLIHQRPYAAIGSGTHLALGSLYSTKGDPVIRSELAVKAACEYSSECQLPIRLVWRPR